MISRDLEALPRGVQTLGGIPFDLRGFIRRVREDAYGSVARKTCGGFAPRICHVPFGQACAANARVVLYRTTWVNPRPEIPIRSLECEFGSTSSSLAIVAITAE